MAEIAKEPAVKADNYNDLDTTFEDEGEVSEKKGTSADRHAMWRMGKVQEMRASQSFAEITALANVFVEEFQIRLDFRLQHDFDGKLGDHARVRAPLRKE
jgi:hypothetical protein